MQDSSRRSLTGQASIAATDTGLVIDAYLNRGGFSGGWVLGDGAGRGGVSRRRRSFRVQEEWRGCLLDGVESDGGKGVLGFGIGHEPAPDGAVAQVFAAQQGNADVDA